MVDKVVSCGEEDKLEMWSRGLAGDPRFCSLLWEEKRISTRAQFLSPYIHLYDGTKRTRCSKRAGIHLATSLQHATN